MNFYGEYRHKLLSVAVNYEMENGSVQVLKGGYRIAHNVFSNSFQALYFQTTLAPAN